MPRPPRPPHADAGPALAALALLLALSAGCDEHPEPSPEGAASDAMPDAMADAIPDAMPDAMPPGPAVDDPGLLFVARRLDAGGARVIVHVDPTSGAVERWGPPLPLPTDHVVQEVMHDAALSRVVVRYEFPVTPPDRRRNNFSHAGYLAAERGGPWRTVVHTAQVPLVMVEPGLRRLGVRVVDPVDPAICQQNTLMTFDGEVIAEQVDGDGRCAPEPRLWGFGPDGAYLMYALGEQLLRVPAGADAADGHVIETPPRQPAGPNRLIALFETSVVISAAGGPGWFDLDGGPLDGPALPWHFFGPRSEVFFGRGDLWRMRDRGFELVHDDPLDSLSFEDYLPERLPEHPDVDGRLWNLWMGFADDGAWVGAVGTVVYRAVTETEPQVIEVDEQVLELWRADPDDGRVRVHRLSRMPWPPPARFAAGGRAVLWVERCGVQRFDMATAAIERFEFTGEGLEILDVQVGEAGWWGGLDDGNGRVARGAVGRPAVNLRNPPPGADCR